LVDLAKLEAAMREDTVLVSIMHVNNEIGVIQDIAQLVSYVVHVKSFSTLMQHSLPVK